MSFGMPPRLERRWPIPHRDFGSLVVEHQAMLMMMDGANTFGHEDPRYRINAYACEHSYFESIEALLPPRTETKSCRLDRRVKKET